MNESHDILEDLLVTCLERHESGGAESVEALLREHPKHEAALRRYLRFLGNMQVESRTADVEESYSSLNLGDFRMIRSIGKGGMGEVYLAEQISLSRQCAVKIVRLSGISESARERFRREAKALARVESAHVVRVIASGEEGELAYLAMDLVEGRGLDEILSETKATPHADFVRHIRNIAHALHSVHEAGLVHRDVKPSNIRITPDGEARLIDFGLARDLSSESLALSASGAFVGTPYYAAPEQLTGGEVDITPLTDVYGLGVSLYECITKRRPHEGKRPEQVFRQILASDPVPADKIEPSISPALASVIGKAIEKDPARRYASALSFAEDLDAVLELRPTRARPDSPIRKLVKWSRRNRGAALSLALLTLTFVIVIVTLSLQSASERERRKQESKESVIQALNQLEQFAIRLGITEKLLSRQSEIVHLMPYRHLSEVEQKELDDIERELAGAEGEREEVFFQILEKLRRAEQLDPDVIGADKVRASVYYEKWQLAQASRDSSLSAFYRSRVIEFDRAKHYDRAMNGGTRLVVTTEPADAEVHLFGLRPLAEIQPHGDFRMVAFPHSWVNAAGGYVGPTESPQVNPGDLCLRVIESNEGFPVDTLITHIGGKRAISLGSQSWRSAAQAGQIARVVIDGTSKEMVLPAGLKVRPTSRPLLFGSDSLLKDPADGFSALSGEMLLLVRREGFASRRLRIQIGLDSDEITNVHIKLDLASLIPPNFVRISWPLAKTGDGPIWMMDREVTCGEYLEFLNSEETLQGIDSSAMPIRFPRTEANAAEGGYWVRKPNGHYDLGDEWQPNMPVLGVSYDDAIAYAHWATQKVRQQGFQISLDLPEQFHYLSFCLGQRFVWGDRFRPQWTNSCHSRAKPGVEAVMSYPIDESAGGIFDVAGNAQEWCSHWFAEEQNERLLFGGSWAHARRERFEMLFASGANPDHAADTFGFRLIARPLQ